MRRWMPAPSFLQKASFCTSTFVAHVWPTLLSLTSTSLRTAPLATALNPLQDGARSQPNLPYLSREAATLRTANTSSTVLIKCAGRGGRQIGLVPGHIHFGTVIAGRAARRAARLVNLSADVMRVHVAPPVPPLRCRRPKEGMQCLRHGGRELPWLGLYLRRASARMWGAPRPHCCRRHSCAAD